MTILYLLDLFGTFVFAISGCILAERKKMDIFGFFIIGFITAVGGGTLRDLLLGRSPVFWLNDIHYFYTIVIATVLVFFLPSIVLKIKNILKLADAVGIAVFTVIGIEVGLSYQLDPVFSIMMGVMTAIVGGILRDILCNEIPLVLQQEIYATACIAGGITFFLLRYFTKSALFLYAPVIALVIMIRVLSLKYNLSLPRRR
ncbi:MAG: trimeric intracellular cation channel family protein [Spirochaetes bacterium]|jgi:uncharacterized membrane protein YeiH|nr:trimeric intracellular cation channel family protein [Spirochaetota bacterium]